MPSYEDDILFLPDLVVFEQDPEWTGLYDEGDRKLVRARPQMGFDLNPKAKAIKRDTARSRRCPKRTR